MGHSTGRKRPFKEAMEGGPSAGSDRDSVVSDASGGQGGEPVLSLSDFFEHSNIPPDLSQPVCLYWVSEMGADPDRFDHVISGLQHLLSGFDEDPVTGVVQHALELAGITLEQLKHTYDFPVLHEKWARTLGLVRVYCMHRSMACINEVEDLYNAAKKQLRNFSRILHTVRDTMADRDSSIDAEVGGVEDGSDDPAEPSKVSSERRFLAACANLALMEGTRKGPNGDVLSPEFHHNKFCFCYKTYPHDTDGLMTNCVRLWYQWMENPMHPNAHRVSGFLDKYDLSGLQGKVNFFDSCSKWLECPHDHLIPQVNEDAQLVSILVDGEPAVFHPGRVALASDEDPDSIIWPSWCSVKDFNPENYGLSSTCVSRCFLKQDASRDWFTIVEGLKQGKHPRISRLYNHVDHPQFAPGYDLMNWSWEEGSIKSLMQRLRVNVKSVWKEAPDSTANNIVFLDTSDGARQFRQAELDLMLLLHNTIRTPCFDAIMHSQGYHLRASMIAGMRLFGYSNVPTQFYDKASKLWTANDASRMCTFVHGLPKTGKSCVAATVAAGWRPDQVFEASANAQSDSWFYANPKAFITLLRELGSARMFVKTQSMTNWLSMCVGETVILNRKNRDPTAMTNPRQPILFFGNGAPFGEFEQWTRRWVILGFNKPLPPGDQQAQLDKQMQERELVPLMIKFSILYRYFLNTYSANEMSDPYTWLPKIYGNFKSIYISESHKLACFLMDEDRWVVVSDETKYTRVEVIREMYKLWLQETGQSRSQPPPPNCSVDNLRTLCQANGLILRILTEDEKEQEGLDVSRTYHCVCRLLPAH